LSPPAPLGTAGGAIDAEHARHQVAYLALGWRFVVLVREVSIGGGVEMVVVASASGGGVELLPLGMVSGMRAQLD